MMKGLFPGDIVVYICNSVQLKFIIHISIAKFVLISDGTYFSRIFIG